VLLNKIFFLILLSVSIASFAMDCDLAKAINHPSLVQKSDFWERLSAINPKDNVAIRKLISEYSNDALATASQASQSVARVSAVAIETSHRAEKAIAKLAGTNIKHYDDFLKVMNEKGVQGFYENPGKWHYERLKMNREHHTVRLDQGYRVLFEVENGQVRVLDIGRHITH
jgi:mRNA-degrading endonuclease RelE of RelBE toxin-antitoxin system